MSHGRILVTWLYRLILSILVAGLLYACQLLGDETTIIVDVDQTRDSHSLKVTSTSTSSSMSTEGEFPTITPEKQTDLALSTSTLEAQRTYCTGESDTSPTKDKPSAEYIDSNILVYKDTTEGGNFWLIDPVSGSKYHFGGGYTPIGWSPSGEQLLLYQDNVLYLAQADSSDITQEGEIPEGKDFKGAWWLSEQCILVQISFAHDDPVKQLDLRVYILDLTTGTFTMVGPDEHRIIQAVSFPHQVWLQGQEHILEMVDLDGTITPILEGFGVVASLQPKSDPSLVFLPSGEKIVFIGAEKVASTGRFKQHIYLADIAEGRVLDPQAIFHPMTPRSLSVSPNSERIAFIDELEDGLILNILDIQTFTLISLKPWESAQSYPVITWSPNAQYIALSYMDQNQSKLVIVDPDTGEAHIIDEGGGFINVIAWISLEIDT